MCSLSFLDLLHHKQESIDVLIEFLDLLYHKQESIDVLIEFLDLLVPGS